MVRSIECFVFFIVCMSCAGAPAHPPSITTRDTGGPDEVSSLHAHYTCETRERGREVWCQGKGPVGYPLDPIMDAHAVEGIAQGRVTSLVTASKHACALTDREQVWCWGERRLGGYDIAPDDRWNGGGAAMVVPDLPSTIVSIKASDDHTCALTRDGRLWCWGDLATQTPDAPISPSASPVWPQHSAPITRYALVYGRGCAWDAARRQVCWGATASGGEPSDIVSLRGSASRKMMSLSATKKSVCGIDDQGAVVCWGEFRSKTSLAESSPHVVALPARAERVIVTPLRACALLETRQVWCWGDNRRDALGAHLQGPYISKDLAFVPHDQPVLMRAISQPVASFCMRRERRAGACVVDDQGVVRCMYGRHHQMTRALTPEPPISRIESITCAGTQACVVTADRDAACWFGTSFLSDQPPAIVQGIGAPVTSVSTHDEYGCALTGRGDVWCWVDRNRRKSDEPLPPAERVQGVPPARSIAVTDERGCAATLDGEVWCWEGPLYVRGGAVPRSRSYRLRGIESARLLSMTRDILCTLSDEGHITCLGGER